MFFKRGSVLIIALALLVLLGTALAGYFFWSLKPTIPGNTSTTKNTLFPTSTPNNENLTPEEAKKSLPLPDSTANWKTFTTKRFVFKYPPDWQVGQFEHFPDMETLQPSGAFVPESQKNSIVVSVSNHCLNTQCLTVFSLEEMINQIGAKIITQTAVDNIKAYKVSFSNGDTGYVFINGPDFIEMTTDKYISEMDKIVPTFKFLDKKDTNETLTVDFSTCPAERKRVDVAFGSTTYEIIGKKSNTCEINYGGEVENPNWDGKLNTNCLVPVSLGKIAFGTTQYGVDFSPIKNYCLTK